MRRKAALRSSGAPVGARVVERIGSGLGSCFGGDSLEGVVVMEREGGCERWLMANAGVVGVETRLFRGERSEARWRLERRVVRKAGCMSMTLAIVPYKKRACLYSRAALDTGKRMWELLTGAGSKARDAVPDGLDIFKVPIAQDFNIRDLDRGQMQLRRRHYASTHYTHYI